MPACQIARVKVSDREWCADAGQYGATCTRTLSARQRDVPKKQWDKERFGMFCTSSDALAEFNTIRRALCDDTGRCDYEFEQKANSFLRRANAIRNKNTQLKKALQSKGLLDR